MEDPKKYVQKFADIVSKIRKTRNLTQDELGKITNTSQMTIQRIESATGGTKLETVLAIAHGLDLGVVDIFQEIEGRTPRPIGDLGSKWDNIVMHVDRMPKAKRDWLAEVLKEILNGCDLDYTKSS